MLTRLLLSRVSPYRLPLSPSRRPSWIRKRPTCSRSSSSPVSGCWRCFSTACWASARPSSFCASSAFSWYGGTSGGSWSEPAVARESERNRRFLLLRDVRTSDRVAQVVFYNFSVIYDALTLMQTMMCTTVIDKDPPLMAFSKDLFQLQTL